jgi:cysteine desulfurase
MAVRGLLAASEKSRVVFGSVEHASHMKLACDLSQAGFQVDLIPVLANGLLNTAAAQSLMGPDVALVSLMAANNETGVLMPVPEIGKLAHAAGALLHVDATQWIGKLPFDFACCGADAVSVSAHKFQGPKGIGALLLRQGTPFVPQTPGSQERGRRGGTENLAGIVGMATALDLLGDIGLEAARLTKLRDTLESGLTRALPETHIWCRDVARLPGTSCLRFGQIPVDVVLQRLDGLGVAASSGAACSSAGHEPSHVLTAMGVPDSEALNAVRFSLGRNTTPGEISTLLNALPPLLELLMTPTRNQR